MVSTEHRKVYISRCYRNLTSAGNKAKTDNETTMREMGFINIGLRQKVSSNDVTVFFYDLASIIKACLAMRKGDELLLQYPVKKYFSLLCHVAHWHGARVTALIHDLGSFRRRKLTVKQEINRLSNADRVVASNATMEQWLKDNGLTVDTGALGLFDYRSPSAPTARKRGNVCRIVYAGSLAPRKNTFFLQLPALVSGYELHIYGNGDAMPSLKDDPHFVFHGFTPADAFIAHNDGDFGLVWDGDSVDACTGSFGGYLRYNSPHKASFYLRSGLPVIVWNEAAIAPIVEREGVGFTIASLRDLPARLAQISDSDFQAMQANAMKMADRLNRGYFFRKAMSE